MKNVNTAQKHYFFLHFLTPFIRDKMHFLKKICIVLKNLETLRLCMKMLKLSKLSVNFGYI